MRLLALALIAVACHPQDVSMSDQLEALEFSVSGADDSDWEGSSSYAGTASVTGDDRDYSFIIDADLTIDIHTPGQSDLAVFDGQDITMTVPGEEYIYGGDSLAVIEDATGPAYIANMQGSPPDLADAIMGEGFVTWGSRQGDEDVANFPEDPSETDHHIFYSAEVETDSGTLELVPGDVAFIDVDGQKWRFVLIAVYKIDDSGWFGSRAKCMSAPDVLSFELLRVDEADDDAVIMRPKDVDPVFVDGC